MSKITIKIILFDIDKFLKFIVFPDYFSEKSEKVKNTYQNVSD